MYATCHAIHEDQPLKGIVFTICSINIKGYFQYGEIKIAQLMQTVIPKHVSRPIINVLLKVNTLLDQSIDLTNKAEVDEKCNPVKLFKEMGRRINQTEVYNKGLFSNTNIPHGDSDVGDGCW